MTFSEDPDRQVWAKDLPRDIFILADTREGMEGLTIIPEVLAITLLQEITVQAMCLKPSMFMSKGIVVAQAYLLLIKMENPSSPLVAWNRIMGCDRLVVECGLSCE